MTIIFNLLARYCHSINYIIYGFQKTALYHQTFKFNNILPFLGSQFSQLYILITLCKSVMDWILAVTVI